MWDVFSGGGAKKINEPNPQHWRRAVRYTNIYTYTLIDVKWRFCGNPSSPECIYIFERVPPPPAHQAKSGTARAQTLNYQKASHQASIVCVYSIYMYIGCEETRETIAQPNFLRNDIKAAKNNNFCHSRLVNYTSPIVYSFRYWIIISWCVY